MTVSNTPRFGLPQWSEGTDPRPGRTDTNTYLRAIEEKAAIFVPSAPLASRPPAGIGGRLFSATDQGDAGRLYFDTGTAWIETGSVGGGGAGKNVVIAGSATEGVSNRSARADHTHNIPLATPANHGALSSEWAELLSSSAVGENANSLVRRTASGSIRGAAPIHAQDLTPKNYVDGKVSDLDDATATVRNGALIKRTSTGHVYLPSSGYGSYDAVSKSYVDGKTWSGDDITSGYIPAARVRYSQWAYNQAWGGSGTVRTVHVTNNYELCFYSSTERHKTNIKPWSIDPREALKVEPVEFDRLNPDTLQPTGVHDYGVRAEQAGQHLPMFIEWGRDKDDQPQVEGWAYMRWTTAHQVVLRYLDQRVTDLEAENDDLRNDLDELRKFYNDLAERILALEDPDA